MRSPASEHLIRHAGRTNAHVHQFSVGTCPQHQALKTRDSSLPANVGRKSSNIVGAAACRPAGQPLPSPSPLPPSNQIKSNSLQNALHLSKMLAKLHARRLNSDAPQPLSSHHCASTGHPLRLAAERTISLLPTFSSPGLPPASCAAPACPSGQPAAAETFAPPASQLHRDIILPILPVRASPNPEPYRRPTNGCCAAGLQAACSAAGHTASAPAARQQSGNPPACTAVAAAAAVG